MGEGPVRFRFLWTDGGGVRRELGFGEGELRIGRSPECEVSIPDYGISRFHARIVAADGRATLFDTKSKGGTQVNGEGVVERELQDGDEVRLGTVELRFEVTPSAGLRDRAAPPDRLRVATRREAGPSPRDDGPPGAERPRPGESSATEATLESLGRREFDLHASRDEIAVRVVLCCFALVLLALLLRWPDTLLDVVLYAVGGGLALAGVASTARRRVAVHERGLAIRKEFGERMLRYDHAERLRFVKMQRTAYGADAGTTLRLEVVGRSGERLSFHTTLGRDASRFDVVRDRLATEIGQRLMDVLHDEGRVEWIRRRRLAGFPGFWLTAEGVLIDGRRDAVLPYRDIEVRWKDGWLELWLSGASKPAARLSSAWENFYPGQLVFLEMIWDYLPVSPRGSR